VRVQTRPFPRQLATQVNTLFARLAADHPDAYTPSQHAVVNANRWILDGVGALHLWIMLGASLLLLVAATISAGNLFLSRALSRRQEIATRAPWVRGQRKFCRSLPPKVSWPVRFAAFGGLLIAQTGHPIPGEMVARRIPRLSEAALNIQSFGFAAGAALLAAVVCSILPGWFITRTNLEAALRTGGARSTVSRTGAELKAHSSLHKRQLP